MKNKYIFLFLILMLIVGCSSVKESVKSDKKIEETQKVTIKLPGYKSDLYEIEFSAKISVNIEGNSQSVNAKVKIAGVDSIAMNITGPFGIAVAKFYASKSEFIFYNIFENSTYIGKPNAENLKKFLNMNISFDDFIRILRGEPLFDIDSYKFMKTVSERTFLFLSKQDSFGDFVVSDSVHNTIISYQRKLKNDSLVMDIQQNNFNFYSKYYIASDIYCKFPTQNSTIRFELSDIKTNIKFESPFKFAVSKNSTLINLNE